MIQRREKAATASHHREKNFDVHMVRKATSQRKVPDFFRGAKEREKMGHGQMQSFLDLGRPLLKTFGGFRLKTTKLRAFPSKRYGKRGGRMRGKGKEVQIPPLKGDRIGSTDNEHGI